MLFFFFDIIFFFNIHEFSWSAGLTRKPGTKFSWHTPLLHEDVSKTINRCWAEENGRSGLTASLSWLNPLEDKGGSPTDLFYTYMGLNGRSIPVKYHSHQHRYFYFNAVGKKKKEKTCLVNVKINAQSHIILRQLYLIYKSF